MKELEELALRMALRNALQHGGKACEKPVVGMVLRENPEFKRDVRAVMEAVSKAVQRVNSMSREEMEELASELGAVVEEKGKRKEEESKLPPLPKAEKGKVVMRIAPFPSGPIHIGNARPFILNDEYVKMYEGRLILVFDDTIGGGGKEIESEAYDLIPEGLEWLGVKWHDVFYKSDRLEIYYKYARKLIEMGRAYVCFCDVDTLREKRRKGIECEHRNHSIEENLEYFEKMLSNHYGEGEASLRIKTDMKYPNPAFRDRVLMRISEREHPRVGKKYVVWPLLEFSWAIDDHLLNITHILRGKDLMMETEMERFIWEIFGWNPPVIIHTGLMRIEGIKLSKSKFQKEVREGRFMGWHDPRTWSMQSLRKRGIMPEAVRRFVLSVGVSEADITVPVDALYKENRRIIDPIANRYFFVHDPVKVSIINTSPTTVRVPLHPDFRERGYREIRVVKDVYICKEDAKILRKEGIIRLKDFVNIRLVDQEGGTLIVKSIGDGGVDLRKIRKVQWVPTNENLKVKAIMPDASVVEGLAELNCAELKSDEVVQFERFGFCRIESNDKLNKELLAYYTHR